MAVVAIGVALDAVDSAFASSRSIPFACWPPPWPLGDPADLSLAHGAPYPVTAPLFQHDHLASGAWDCLTSTKHVLYHLPCPPGVFVGSCILLHLFLILLAIHALMNYLTGEAVSEVADRAQILIHIVLINAPPSAVWSLAVKGILDLAFGYSHGLGQVLLINVLWNNCFNFPVLQNAITSIVCITVGALHLCFFRIDYCASQTLPAETVKAFPEYNTILGGNFVETNGAIKLLLVWYNIVIFEVDDS